MTKKWPGTRAVLKMSRINRICVVDQVSRVYDKETTRWGTFVARPVTTMQVTSWQFAARKRVHLYPACRKTNCLQILIPLEKLFHHQQSPTTIHKKALFQYLLQKLESTPDQRNRVPEVNWPKYLRLYSRANHNILVKPTQNNLATYKQTNPDSCRLTKIVSSPANWPS